MCICLEPYCNACAPFNLKLLVGLKLSWAYVGKLHVGLCTPLVHMLPLMLKSTVDSVTPQLEAASNLSYLDFELNVPFLE